MLCKLGKSEILRLYSIAHVAWKLGKRQIVPVVQNLSSVYLSLANFQLVSYNLSLNCHDLANDIYSQTAKTLFSHLK